MESDAVSARIEDHLERQFREWFSVASPELAISCSQVRFVAGAPVVEANPAFPEQGFDVTALDQRSRLARDETLLSFERLKSAQMDVAAKKLVDQPEGWLGVGWFSLPASPGSPGMSGLLLSVRSLSADDHMDVVLVGTGSVVWRFVLDHDATPLTAFAESCVEDLVTRCWR